MNARTLEAVKKHGANLQTIFNLTGDPVTLCKRLRRLENEGNRFACAMCNVGMNDDVWESGKANILARVDKILGFSAKEIPVFFNGDPRGYCLKVNSEWMREHREYALHLDWGGYGIIAPDLSE